MAAFRGAGCGIFPPATARAEPRRASGAAGLTRPSGGAWRAEEGAEAQSARAAAPCWRHVTGGAAPGDDVVAGRRPDVTRPSRGATPSPAVEVCRPPA
jgi:hypothetical protein